MSKVAQFEKIFKIYCVSNYGDKYCKLYVLMSDLWLFGCFSPPLSNNTVMLTFGWLYNQKDISSILAIVTCERELVESVVDRDRWS